MAQRIKAKRRKWKWENARGRGSALVKEALAGGVVAQHRRRAKKAMYSRHVLYAEYLGTTCVAKRYVWYGALLVALRCFFRAGAMW